MPDISKINALAIGSVSKVDGLAKASILDINGLTVPSAAFLLDTYTGAASGYSVRRIASSATNLIRIREDSGDTETDIGYDSNGDLDTAAIASHCGSANGYVVTWYDQAGSNNATQSTGTSQPQIYNGTAVITENGKPAMEFVTLVTFMESVSNIGISGTGDRTHFIVGTCTDISTNATASILSYGADPGAGVAWQNTFEPWVRVGSGYQSFSGTSPNTQHLYTTALVSGTNVTDTDMFIDGSTATAGAAASRVLNTTDSTLKVGAGASGSPLYDGTIQEIIVYASDQITSNRTGIESDINSEYLIYQPTDAPTSGLLATYTGAAAAYSVRQLSDKAVIAITVRRDSDDEEKRFGFDSNGDLDTTGIADFCTTANGYVSQWWDQSTNGNHATQSTSSAQPKIYDGTTGIITANGKPAVDADAVDYSGFPINLGLSQPFTNFVVGENTIALGSARWYGFSPQMNAILNASIYAGTFLSTTVDLRNTEHMMWAVYNGTNSKLKAISPTTSQEVSGNAGTDTGFNYLLRRYNFDQANNLRANEIIFWDSEQSSSNLTGIESDLDTYYAIT